MELGPILAMLLPLAFFPWTLDPFFLPKQVLLIVAACAAGVAILVSGVRLPSSRVVVASLLALCLAEVLALAASVDRLPSILGNFGYRMGFVSHTGLGLLWLAGFTLVRSDRVFNRLFSVSILTSLLVCSYTVLQFLDADPLDWEDSSSRAFSTLGNPNDLAGYLVLSVCFAAAAPFGWKRVPAWFVPGFLSVLAVSVLLTESRSGFIGMALAMAMLPALAHFAGWPSSSLRRMGAGMAIGALAVLFFAAVSGEAGRISERFSQSLSGEQVGIGTRQDIWRGSLAAYASHPLFGVGQDGLLVTFNRERPADLGPTFSIPAETGIDPLVGSPHSLPIEVLVTIGPVGATAVAMLFGWHGLVFWRALRSRRQRGFPYLGAGVLGYLVVASMNPVSLSSAAVACLLAGIVAGRSGASSGPLRLPPRLIPAVRTTGALTAAGLAAIGMLLFAGDRAAYESLQHTQAGEHRRAVERAARAARLVPFESSYRRMAIQTAYESGVRSQDLPLLERALEDQREFLRDFAGLPTDYLTLAQLLLLLDQPGVDEALAAARAASPHGVDTALSAQQIASQQR